MVLIFIILNLVLLSERYPLICWNNKFVLIQYTVVYSS